MTLKRSLTYVLGFILVLALVTGFGVNQYRHEIYQAGLESEATKLGLRLKTTPVDSISWSYWENDLKGQKPTLVLIHGFGASKATWLALAKYIANDFHLVIPDLPGHGDSSFDLSQTYSLDTQTGQFNAFAEALGLEHFHLMGNSMGGGITGLYAGTYPDKLLSAILLNPAGIVEYRSDYQQRLDNGENPLLVNSVADLDFLFEYAVAEKITIHWPFDQVMVDNAIEKRPVMSKVFADLTADPTYSIKSAVKNITAPTLVVWGKLDRIIAPENAAIYQQTNPAIQVKLLEHVGHIPMVEIPEACAGILLDFVHSATK